MNYQMEELLPLVTELSEKYTSKESSSITYETAEMLMEAAMYCIQEGERAEHVYAVAAKAVSVQQMYKAGYERVVQKVYKAKEIYDRIIFRFDDFGCRNYKETMLEGMPAFFKKYDAKFQPQNHLLTLDYPLLVCFEDLCGVDLIYQYLRGIELESKVLSCFPADAVRLLLSRVESNYDIMYMDNLCALALQQALGCMLADRVHIENELDSEDLKKIKMFFEGDNLEKIEEKAEKIFRILLNKAGLSSQKEYFKVFTHESAVRIFHALENDAFGGLFFSFS